jgi:hypothetical protein
VPLPYNAQRYVADAMPAWQRFSALIFHFDAADAISLMILPLITLRRFSPCHAAAAAADYYDSAIDAAFSSRRFRWLPRFSPLIISPG